MSHDWKPARDALDRAHAEGRTVEVWLRDDDCVAVTPALERLAALCGAAALPVLLAVIPAEAAPDLVPWIAGHPAITPCQHGYAHADHAPPGERARELGGRPVGTVLAELARGRARLRGLFGPALSDILVPPWNRLDADLVPHLPAAGYAALSAFGPTPADSPIPRLDADLDIIDWRRGRIGRPPDELARKLAAIVARQDRLGLLTHHLAHDAAAWAGLEALLENLAGHPAVRFTDTAELLPAHPDGTPGAQGPGSAPLSAAAS